MTIKEFALLAGVSVSTVSKIMNGKDASISARTREHVLKLAKEYNYVPYASAAAPTTRTLTMGVIFQNTEHGNGSSPASSKRLPAWDIRCSSGKAGIRRIRSLKISPPWRRPIRTV